MIHAHAPLQRPWVVQVPLIWVCETPCSPPALGHVSALAAPHPPRGGWPHTRRVQVSECPRDSCGPAGGSGWGQSGPWGAVLPGPGRAPGGMGPHLAGWHQHHCCPAPLFSCLLQILVFYLCICLDDFFPQRSPNSPVTVWSDWWLSSSLPRSVLGIPLMHTLTRTFLSCRLLLFWTLCQCRAHQVLVTHQGTNHWNIPCRSEVAMGQSCYASVISMLLS